MGINIMDIISKIDIYPNYYYGFTFVWKIHSTFVAPYPWKFTVQESKDLGATWEDVSPEIENKFCYTENKRRIYPKEEVTQFRIKIVISGKTSYSFIVDPYGVTERRIYLLSREIMRKHMLAMKKMSGTALKLYSQSIFAKLPGPVQDPITGDITDPQEAIPHMYSGPYDIWATIEEFQRTKKVEESQGMGVVEESVVKLSTVGYPVIKRDDVLVDPEQDKRYYISVSQPTMTLHGFMVLQSIVAHEISPSDPIYLLDGKRIEEARENPHE